MPATEVEDTVKRRLDYRKPGFWIKEVQLCFDISDEQTIVSSKLFVESEGNAQEPLVLDGEELELQEVTINEKILLVSDYEVRQESLTILRPPQNQHFTVGIRVKIDPANNTSNKGMYGKNVISTQCEAESFRNITYMLDRPDVMARYTRVRIEANKEKYPILLSNGNMIESGDVGNNRHFVVWQDPFPKPSYLFALVAGNLGVVKDEFTTKSGRKVQLKLWSDPEDVDSLTFAMRCVKQAMKWDEDAFGLEFDLDLFNVVAIRDFNMGAMENKGLNIFRTSLLLAKPNIATDIAYENIQGVVAHEYFHNWTGNRVTCRDWFQLTLKEGLTVFRDQCFSEDMTQSICKRIECVRRLRESQFPEDSGPLAHPIRPESYIVMDNFYTTTVYDKGAEVIRMIQTIIGKEVFRKGMDLYFSRHDGSAVTCEDFVNAMADASGVDLTQFFLWYSTAGTPMVTVKGQYDPTQKRFSLTLKQSIPPTPGQPIKPALHIPIVTGLLSLATGKELVASQLLHLREAEQTFDFENVSEPPLPSILRRFSAPVRLQFDQSDEELAMLMAHDTDTFNRWDSAQRLASRVILNIMKTIVDGTPLDRLELPSFFVGAFRTVLENTSIERSLQAYTVTLPSLSMLFEELLAPVDFDALLNARDFVVKSLSKALRSQFIQLFEALAPPAGYQYDVDTVSIGRRRMRGVALDYLCQMRDSFAVEKCVGLFQSANCLTERIQALSGLSFCGGDEYEKALTAFYDSANGNSLLVDQWFSMQGRTDEPTIVDRVRRLMKHPAFSMTDVSRVDRLVWEFCVRNLPRFHDRSGEGYRLLGDVICDLDKVNPTISGDYVNCLSRFRKFAEPRQTLMKAQLERLLNLPGVSKNVREMVTKSLEA